MFTFIFVYKGSILSGGCPGVFREFPRVLQGVPGLFLVLQGQGQETGGLCEMRDWSPFPNLSLRSLLKICNYISVLLAEITEDLSKQRWIRWFFYTKTELIVFSVTLA